MTAEEFFAMGRDGEAAHTVGRVYVSESVPLTLLERRVTELGLAVDALTERVERVETLAERFDARLHASGKTDEAMAAVIEGGASPQCLRMSSNADKPELLPNADTPETDASRVAIQEGMMGDTLSITIKGSEWSRVTKERDEARAKLERQAERIRDLEGATNHAGGTPLAIALRERDEARALAKWFYKRLKQVCLDHPLLGNVSGIVARLEEAVLDDPWLEEAAK